MTAVATLTGALSDRMTVWRLQARMVKVVPDSWHDLVPHGAFARLELLERKLLRAVLRELGGSNPVRLSGIGETCRKVTRPDPTHSIHVLAIRSASLSASVASPALRASRISFSTCGRDRSSVTRSSGPASMRSDTSMSGTPTGLVRIVW
jgi:hypothetical protein